MFRLGRRLPPVQQRNERLLEDILRLAMAQAQRPAVENQLPSLRLVKALAPTQFGFHAHTGSLDRHLSGPICIKNPGQNRPFSWATFCNHKACRSLEPQQPSALIGDERQDPRQRPHVEPLKERPFPGIGRSFSGSTWGRWRGSWRSSPIRADGCWGSSERQALWLQKVAQENGRFWPGFFIQIGPDRCLSSEPV